MYSNGVLNMGELSKRIYFGGPHAQRRWNNYKQLARLHFKGSVAALIRDAISQLYDLDPETGESLSNDTGIVADAPSKNPRFKKKKS
jgi:hypothetical protein